MQQQQQDSEAKKLLELSEKENHWCLLFISDVFQNIFTKFQMENFSRFFLFARLLQAFEVKL